MHFEGRESSIDDWRGFVHVLGDDKGVDLTFLQEL